MPCRARQADTSIIHAIDLEFATVYYAAHDLAYGMAGTSIKGAAAKRSFVRAYIEELSGAPAKDDEVDSLALDAELFALPMHIGPLCCLHGECKLNKEEDDDSEPIALRLLMKRLQVEKLVQRCAEARQDAVKCEALLEKGLGRSLGAADLSSCMEILKATFARDPSLVAAATSPAVLKCTLTSARMPLAAALLENGADPAAAREALLAEEAKLLRNIALDPNSVSLVDTLCKGDHEIKSVLQSPQTLLAALKPATAAAALALLERTTVDFEVVRDALLADKAKLLCALMVDARCVALVDALCTKDKQIQAAATSPALQQELLLAALQPSTWELGLKLVQEQGVTDAVRKALTDGDAAVTPTRALSFDGDAWLEDDGADLPLGNDPYTWELWIRFTGHGPVCGFGGEGDGHANCLYFHDSFNHCALRLRDRTVSTPEPCSSRAQGGTIVTLTSKGKQRKKSGIISC